MPYYPHQVRFSLAELPGQFLLTRRDLPAPSGWRTEQHGAWQLHHASPLACVRVTGPCGALAGWVLGHAIWNEVLLADGVALSLSVAGNKFARMVDHLNGRFIAIDLSGLAPVVYPDGQATLGVVYSEAEECVGSTTSVIPLSADSPFDLDRILACDIPYSAAHYPLGLTHRRGVERLLPNHRLDLDGWKHERRWPRSSIGETMDPPSVVALVRQSLTVAMSAIRSAYPINLTLTAGRDSRMMLSCARRYMADSRISTADFRDPTSSRDVAVASGIAARFRLDHHISRARSGPEDLRLWVARTGGETGEPRGWRGSRALAAQPAGYATVLGTAADLSKIQGWRKLFLTRPIRPEDLLDYCHVPYRREFVERAESWMAGLSGLSPFEIADLAQVEQSQAAWGGVIEYGELGQSSARLSPMTSAALVHACLRLPVDYRIAMSLHTDVIRAEWPELLDFPFNEDFGLDPVEVRAFDRRARFGRTVEFGARQVRRAMSWAGAAFGIWGSAIS